MSYSNCQANSKAPAFVTKVPHDVVLTQTDTRIFVKNIKTGVTIDQFKNAMEKYGPVQVYLYEHGSKDNGWAWVGFEDKETAEKAVRDYECGADIKENKPEESNSAPNDNAQNEDEEEEKHETNSFYAEAEEQNESEANDNDESVKEEESDEEAD